MNDIVVYTAISSGYDNLKVVPDSWRGNARFVAFLDETPTENNHGWEIQPLPRESSDPCRCAKKPKILPHLFFPNANYTLWIDGALVIKSSLPLPQWVNEYLSRHDLAVFSNDYYDCIYKEARMCRRSGLDYPQVIHEQMERYRAEGYPENNGLVDCGVIFRRTSEANTRFNLMWYREIMTGSRRDQLSFNYVAHKLKMTYELLPGTYYKNPHFQWTRHALKRKKLTKIVQTNHQEL